MRDNFVRRMQRTGERLLTEEGSTCQPFWAPDTGRGIREMAAFPHDTEIATAQWTEFNDRWLFLSNGRPVGERPELDRHIVPRPSGVMSRDIINGTMARLIRVEPTEVTKVSLIPLSLRNHGIESAHKSIPGGHLRAQTTGAQEDTDHVGVEEEPGYRARLYDLRDMRHDGSGTRHRARPYTTGSTWTVRRHVHSKRIDFVGPFHPAVTGESCMLTMIDWVLRCTVVAPVQDTAHTTAARTCVDSWGWRFDTPAQIVSDNGSHFSDGTWQDRKDRVWTEHVKVAVYHLRSNGAIERVHSTLKEK